MDPADASRGLELLNRYVHASGSLHELAEAYGMAPRVRALRVDRLIDRIKTPERRYEESPFEQVLRVKYVYGKIGRPILRELMNAYREFLRGTV